MSFNFKSSVHREGKQEEDRQLQEVQSSQPTERETQGNLIYEYFQSKHGRALGVRSPFFLGASISYIQRHTSQPQAPLPSLEEGQEMAPLESPCFLSHPPRGHPPSPAVLRKVPRRLSKAQSHNWTPTGPHRWLQLRLLSIRDVLVSLGTRRLLTSYTKPQLNTGLSGSWWTEGRPETP